MIIKTGYMIVFLLYSGKLLREKTFTNFAFLWLFAKVFALESFPLYGITSAESILCSILSTQGTKLEDRDEEKMTIHVQNKLSWEGTN